jgi:ATP-dependent DNA helicase RecQ
MEEYNFLSYIPRQDKPQLQLVTEMLDTRYFALSKENYSDRKREAEERVRAVEDYVNNNQECRSVQLLNYFNEPQGKACGRCDVCVSHGTHAVGNEEFGKIRTLLKGVLCDRQVNIGEALHACRDFEEESVMEVIRWMIDEGTLNIKDDVLSLKKT